MKQKKTVFSLALTIFTVLFFILSLSFIGYRIITLRIQEKNDLSDSSTEKQAEADSNEEAVVSVISRNEEPEKITETVLEDGSTVYTASVVAVGDNLYHKSVINSGWRESGTPDYIDMY